MSTPDMMAHLRALPLGLRGMGIGDPDGGGRIEAAEVVRWAIGEIERLRLADAERWAVERAAVWMMTLARDRREIQSAVYLADDAATLRALLQRHEKGGET